MGNSIMAGGKTMESFKYKPMYLYKREFEKSIGDSAKTFTIALERGANAVKRYAFDIGASAEFSDANYNYAERIVKFMLWSFGGYKFYTYGDADLTKRLADDYSPGGKRQFDLEFMKKVYQKKISFTAVAKLEDLPEEQEIAADAPGGGVGARIGFDAGGSDRKVTAVKDGKVVFEEETIWFPKLNSDPNYHVDGINDSISKALNALGGKVDAIGVSSAGIIVDGEVRVASLFRKVPDEVFKEKIFNIYKDLGNKYGCPIKIANDGDVAALAGAHQLGKGKVLGIAMGTSLAAGYVDENMRIKGYLNELAFVPVDADKDAFTDEWSGDYGVGGVYHSQDGVINLAPLAGFELNSVDSPAEKLKALQRPADAGDEAALDIFKKLGEIFGYTLLWFGCFYDVEHVMLLGRVTSGKGGEALLKSAERIIESEGGAIKIFLPDEMSRRLGQSYTAALM